MPHKDWTDSYKDMIEVVNTPFLKFDDDKLQYDLLPLDAIDAVTKVMMHGAKKYEKDNWRKAKDDPKGKDRYYNALLRHLFAWIRGENIDRDSGMHHLYHVACNALFLAELFGKERDIDENKV